MYTSHQPDQSPADYLLYYKRATAYFSMQRHTSALEDFERVLSLTSNTFDNAHLMKARIHLREGQFALAKTALELYTKSKGKDNDAEEVERNIVEGDRLRRKSLKERNAELWNACVDSASQALRIASHSVEVRVWRTECSLSAGDVEGSVGDLTYVSVSLRVLCCLLSIPRRLSHLLPPSTQLLTRIFKLSYFLLPPSSSAPQLLKQCLHYDPDSKPCLTLRRMAKSFDKAFAQLEELVGKEDWKGIIKLLVGSGAGKNGDLWKRYEEALLDNVGQERDLLPLVPSNILEQVTPSPSSTSKSKQRIYLPLATKVSPQRQILVKALCKSYTRLADVVKSSTEYKKQTEKWCEELLTLDGRKEDVDGLVGRGEALLAKQEFDEAVRVLEKAFEASGKGDRDVRISIYRFVYIWGMLIFGL